MVVHLDLESGGQTEWRGHIKLSEASCFDFTAPAVRGTYSERGKPYNFHTSSLRCTFITHGPIKGRKKEKIFFFYLKSDGTLLLLLDSLTIRNKWLYCQEVRWKKYVIAFNLICLYCSTQEKADRSRTSGSQLCPCVFLLQHSASHSHPHSPCAPVCKRSVHRTAAATREGTDTSLITPAISASIIKHRRL